MHRTANFAKTLGITVAEANAYHANRGNTAWAALSTLAKESSESLWNETRLLERCLG